MTTIVWELPIKTVSEANSSEHWTVKAKRHRVQQFFVRMAFHAQKTQPTLPCCVKMTRLGGRRLDAKDNLPMALKYVADAIADQLVPGLRPGMADDDPRITWEYAQEKAKKPGIRIEITYDTSSQSGSS